MRITLMHNPKAGKRNHKKKALVAALENAGHRVTYQSTKKKGYQKALKKQTDLVLVAGGDGTVGKVGRELMDTGIPMAILPLGTVNNLARTLGFLAPIKNIVNGLRRANKRVFDVGIARGPWGKREFLEGVGSGLFADFVYEMEGNNGDKLSKEQLMRQQVSVLRRMVHDYKPRKWKIDIDGHDGSGRYILWEAMNIRSVGPALYLAPRAATKDGYLDFVTADEKERPLLLQYLDNWLEGRRKKFPLRISRCRKVKIASENSRFHLDGKIWPKKKQTPRESGEIELSIETSALVILQPRR